MADIAPILAKVRALGADVVFDNGQMKITNGALLTEEQRSWIIQHRSAIEDHLAPALTGALPDTSENDTPPMTWGQTARILYQEPPDGMGVFDWSYFVTEAGKVLRRHFGVDE